MSPSSRAEGGLFGAALRRALSRPWLLAPPLAGAAARRLIEAALAGDAGAATGSILGSAVTVAACAACAELWLAEHGRPDWVRVRDALALYVLPILVLGAVGLAAAEFFYVALRGGAASNLSTPILATIVAGKLASGLATIWVSFALARWSRARGVFGSLRAGAGLLAAHAGLCAVLVLGAWAAQEAAGFALGPLVGAAAGTSFFAIFGTAADALVAAVALAACVVLPLQAASEAR